MAPLYQPGFFGILNSLTTRAAAVRSSHTGFFKQKKNFLAKYQITSKTPQANIYSNMTPEEKLNLEERVVEILKTVYDPEIPVDIYNLGLIYRIELHDDGTLDVDMTLTAPNCPAADFIVEDVRIKLDGITGIKEAHVNLVFEPEWDKDMMSEEAKLELGFM